MIALMDLASLIWFLIGAVSGGAAIWIIAGSYRQARKEAKLHADFDKTWASVKEFKHTTPLTNEQIARIKSGAIQNSKTVIHQSTPDVITPIIVTSMLMDHSHHTPTVEHHVDPTPTVDSSPVPDVTPIDTGSNDGGFSSGGGESGSW